MHQNVTAILSDKDLSEESLSQMVAGQDAVLKAVASNVYRAALNLNGTIGRLAAQKRWLINAVDQVDAYLDGNPLINSLGVVQGFGTQIDILCAEIVSQTLDLEWAIRTYTDVAAAL